MDDQELSELRAAELLLARATRERDEAQWKVDWLTSVVESHRGNGPTSPLHGPPPPPVLKAPKPADRGVQSDEPRGPAGELEYGAVRAHVERYLASANRKVTMADVATDLVVSGMRSDKETAMISARNAVRGLIKAGRAKKFPRFRYAAMKQTGTPA